MASPVVKTPVSIEVVVDEAAGDVMNTGCRPAAITPTAATRATSDTPATETKATRADVVM